MNSLKADRINVGHDLLQLLTTAMYTDPMIMYREYLQNAVDSLELLQENSLPTTQPMRNAEPAGKVQPDVSITIERSTRSVTISDHGVGVENSQFEERMVSIGSSKKRGMSLRGFRGIGRLVGLAYCRKLRFRSRSTADEPVLEIEWDCAKLRQMLRSPQSISIDEAVRELVSVTHPTGSFKDHFFEVELVDVLRLSDDRLLNISEVESFLSAVGPVPFDPQFSYGETIKAYLTRFMNLTEINVSVNGRPFLRRPFHDKIGLGKEKVTHISGIRLLEFPAHDDGFSAIGWIADHDYIGAFPDRLGVSGIRARHGNLQIGTASIFDSAFVEPRFNSWALGELHIFDSRIIPNGRRDAFEPGIHLDNLHNQLGPVAQDIIKRSRTSSQRRQRIKKLRALLEGGRLLVGASRTEMSDLSAIAFIESTSREVSNLAYQCSLLTTDPEIDMLEKDLKQLLSQLRRRANRKKPSRNQKAKIDLLTELFSAPTLRTTLLKHFLKERARR